MEKTGFSQAYAFTVTLKPELFKKFAEIQYDLTSGPLKEHLYTITPKFTVVAELTKNCNIHYHGVIYFLTDRCKDAIKCFKDKFRNHKLFGFVDIKVIDDMEGWYEYISKELEHTNTILCRRPILFDSADIYPTDHFTLYGIM